MKIQKCFKHAFEMVVHSKLRSWLTILGIIIGVAAVIAITSIGSGMQQQMNDQLGGLGGDLLTLTAGYSRGSSMFGPPGGGPEGNAGGATDENDTPELTSKDIQALKSIPEISLIDTEIRGNVKASFLGKSGTVSLTGVDQKVWSQITTLEIADGRMLDSADQNVIVIGGKLANSYFGKKVGLNQVITIDQNVYRVVGILDDESNSIYMPVQMAYQVIDDSTNGVYDTIVIKVKDQDQLDAIINKTQTKLMLERHVTEKTIDFSVTSSKKMQETRTEMMSTMNTFLIAIAAVSLIVGAVGIANTMFTSVLEKTKDIGIMKAIGARNKDILLIFLLNACLIGLVGGILGTIFGIILSGALPALMGQTALLRGGTFVSIDSIIVAMSVSIGIGILAGIIPAYKGSKLKPVDALRYE
jgi:putative ABC transport system permease protein